VHGYAADHSFRDSRVLKKNTPASQDKQGVKANFTIQDQRDNAQAVWPKAL